jgi:hypothetical protein
VPRRRPEASTVNYPLVASGQARFSSAGSYTEINFSKDGASFIALTDTPDPIKRSWSPIRHHQLSG